MSESGNVIMPENIANIWMSEAELVSLLGVIAPTVCAAIKTIYKSGILKEYEAQRYIRLSDKIGMDVYSLEMVVVLAFRINSYGADGYAMPFLKGCTCEKRKQASSFRWV